MRAAAKGSPGGGCDTARARWSGGRLWLWWWRRGNGQIRVRSEGEVKSIWRWGLGGGREARVSSKGWWEAQGLALDMGRDELQLQAGRWMDTRGWSCGRGQVVLPTGKQPFPLGTGAGGSLKVVRGPQGRDQQSDQDSCERHLPRSFGAVSGQGAHPVKLPILAKPQSWSARSALSSATNGRPSDLWQFVALN